MVASRQSQALKLVVPLGSGLGLPATQDDRVEAGG